MGNLGKCTQVDKCPNCILREEHGYCTILEKNTEFSKPCSFYKTIEQANEQDADIGRFYRTNPNSVTKAREIISQANEHIRLNHEKEKR